MRDQSCREAGDTVSFAEKIAFLKRPSSYPGRPRSVEAIETHMAWVFLAGSSAYKIKKPIRRSFLNFGSVAARRRDAHEEVRLNRRLAPDVYRGAVRLSCDASGHLALTGTGETVDWLVWMRRLPRDQMLDVKIERGTLTAADVRSVAARLARFYRNAKPVRYGPDAYLERFITGARETLRVLQQPPYGVESALVAEMEAVLDRFFCESGNLLKERARRVGEGHGDLRPEHVCLETEPIVIDCLAFNREFRLLDPADELSFLVLECERLGAAHIGSVLWDAYRQETEDDPPDDVRGFYRAYRAGIRAKLAIWHLDDDDVRRPETWRALAESYLRLGVSTSGATVPAENG
jgi:aminoglycoside phosphotransferase family enzyme